MKAQCNRATLNLLLGALSVTVGLLSLAIFFPFAYAHHFGYYISSSQEGMLGLGVLLTMGCAIGAIRFGRHTVWWKTGVGGLFLLLAAGLVIFLLFVVDIETNPLIVPLIALALYSGVQKSCVYNRHMTVWAFMRRLIPGLPAGLFIAGFLLVVLLHQTLPYHMYPASLEFSDWRQILATTVFVGLCFQVFLRSAGVPFTIRILICHGLILLHYRFLSTGLEHYLHYLKDNDVLATSLPLFGLGCFLLLIITRSLELSGLPPRATLCRVQAGLAWFPVIGTGVLAGLNLFIITATLIHEHADPKWAYLVSASSIAVIASTIAYCVQFLTYRLPLWVLDKLLLTGIAIVWQCDLFMRLVCWHQYPNSHGEALIGAGVLMLPLVGIGWIVNIIVCLVMHYRSEPLFAVARHKPVEPS